MFLADFIFYTAQDMLFNNLRLDIGKFFLSDIIKILIIVK